MRSADELMAVAAEGVKVARSKGAEAAEAFVIANETTTVSAIGSYAAPRQRSGEGIAVRVIGDGRMGFAGTSGSEGWERIVGDALASAGRLGRPERGVALPEARTVTREPTTVDPALSDVDPDRLESIVASASDALSAQGHATYATLGVKSSWGRFAVASTEGVASWDQRGRETFTMEARIERAGVSQTALHTTGRSSPLDDHLDAPGLATEVARRAYEACRARPLDASVAHVLLEPGPLSQFIAPFASALSARRAQADQSALAGRLGERVASDSVTLRDEPWSDEAAQRLRVDHEGMPTEPVAAVTNGVLEGYFYDAAAAAAEKRASNGHGFRRSGVTGGIGIAPVHLVLEPGEHSREELFDLERRMVHITDPVSGSFTTDLTTGDLSLVSPYAFLVENGEVTRALPAVTLGGNLFDIVQRVGGLEDHHHELQGGHYPAAVVGGIACAT